MRFGFFEIRIRIAYLITESRRENGVRRMLCDAQGRRFLKACQNYLMRRNIETLKFRTSMGSSVDGKFALELTKIGLVKIYKALRQPHLHRLVLAKAGRHSTESTTILSAIWD